MIDHRQAKLRFDEAKKLGKDDSLHFSSFKKTGRATLFKLALPGNLVAATITVYKLDARASASLISNEMHLLALRAGIEVTARNSSIEATERPEDPF